MAYKSFKKFYNLHTNLCRNLLRIKTPITLKNRMIDVVHLTVVILLLNMLSLISAVALTLVYRLSLFSEKSLNADVEVIILKNGGNVNCILRK